MKYELKQVITMKNMFLKWTNTFNISLILDQSYIKPRFFHINLFLNGGISLYWNTYLLGSYTPIIEFSPIVEHSHYHSLNLSPFSIP